MTDTVHNLQHILTEQRARRNAAAPSSPRVRRSHGGAMAVAVLAFVLLLGAGFWLWDRDASQLSPAPANLPVTQVVATAKRVLPPPSPTRLPFTPWTMTVCEGVVWLHVRFEPKTDAAVRGYLRGGEQVVLVERQGGWVLLSAPVNGWADSRYLCGGAQP
ncbi:MAG: SH3 domain-containing protein [Anaerolineales bacterium]|nr:hypothetical protein [Anaerolineales bacterium]MCZ7550371.1 SH3 domain-containing protein [Anaerolineales bacterium]MDX9935790.1 SH3 domain-containing protein [Anaerolineales bacterium]HPP63281.1 SH3 domain-containing protein [Anaerolineales bacterium]